MHSNQNITVKATMNNANEASHEYGPIETERITSAIAACIGRLRLANRSALYDAHDLVQEVWVRLLSNGCSILNKYNADRGASLEYYVSMVARREAGNLLRKEKAERRGGYLIAESGEKDMDEFIGTIPEPILEARDSMSKLSSWITSKGIPKKGMEIFHSTANREAPVDIANQLGVPLQIVYNWQHRIRELSRLFKKKMDDTSHAPASASISRIRPIRIV